MPRIIVRNPALRERAKQHIDAMPYPFTVRVDEGEPRSLDQNAKLWPSLSDISRQVDWYGQSLTPDEWKDVFTAALKRQKVVPGLDGGFVVIGQRTSKMSKSDFSDLLTLIMAFGDEKGVKFTHDPDSPLPPK